MKVLFATTNPAKIKRYAKKLKEKTRTNSQKCYRKCIHKSQSIL